MREQLNSMAVGWSVPEPQGERVTMCPSRTSAAATQRRARLGSDYRGHGQALAGSREKCGRWSWATVAGLVICACVGVDAGAASGHARDGAIPRLRCGSASLPWLDERSETVGAGSLQHCTC